MKTVNIQEAKTHLSRLLEEAAAGEEIVLQTREQRRRGGCLRTHFCGTRGLAAGLPDPGDHTAMSLG